MDYKLRAECGNDVLEFKKVAGENITSIGTSADARFPDEEFSFKSDLSLLQVRSLLRKVVDGHVMVQTVQSIKEFTGIRDCNIPI